MSDDRARERVAAIRPPSRLRSFLGALAVAGALLAVLRPPESLYLRLLQTGAQRANRGEWIAALADFRAAAEVRPDDPQPHLRTAYVYLAWGRYGPALDALAEAQARGASRSAVDRLRLEILAAEHEWEALEDCAIRLLDDDPQLRVAHHALARAYEGEGRWDAARKEYEALLEADPGDAVALERLALLTLGDEPTALAQLAGADTPLAAQILAALQGGAPYENPAHIWLLAGSTLLEAQEWALAARQFERAWQQEPTWAQARAYYGYALGRAGRAREGRRHLESAVAEEPSSALAHALLGLHYERSGDLEAARLEYEAAYDLDPENAALCAEIGEVWAAEHRYLAAEIWLREATALEPDDAELWMRLARFYLDHSLDIEERGAPAAQRALELAPEDARAHDLVGWAAFLMGDYRMAQVSLERALKRDPRLSEAHYHLGRLWDAQGRAMQAEAAYVRALESDSAGRLEPLIRRAAGKRWAAITRGVLPE